MAYYHAYQWWRMTDEEFGEQFLEVDESDRQVTGKYLAGQEITHPRVLSGRARRTLLASAKTAYEYFDYQRAAELYEQALDLDLQDGESRVHAARCYVLLEDGESAYRHLAMAFQLGATNLDLVAEHPDFAWLRTRDDFDARRRAGFGAIGPRSPGAAPAAEREGTALPPPSISILDGLERLADLRERGVLDDEEFSRQKERLLRG